MRKIKLIGEVDALMFKDFSDQLDILLRKHLTKPIDIELCSHGGDESAAFAFYGRMNSSTAPLHITTYGEVASAAILILAAGDWRRVDAATTLMVHESSEDVSGETHQVKQQVKRLETAEVEFYRRVASHTKLSLEDWLALSKKTTYFNADSALLWGIADEVVNNVKMRKV